jgi:hypothetical protein
MSRMSQKLAAMEAFLSSHPTAEDENDIFKELRA